MSKYDGTVISEYDQMKQKVGTIEPLKITFDKPVFGNWDGGSKSEGTFDFMFRSGGFDKKPNLKYHLEVGAWELNFFFRMAIPKNINAARSIALRMLRKKCKMPCKIV